MHTQFPMSECNVRLYDKAAIVRNLQHNQAVYKDQPVEIATRVMQVWVTINGRWQLAGIQFSPWSDDK
ncbi:MAG: nuclear transport factor 2 family protein [Caldilinea sp. CFX5]|nr:nuclear transport factor 2 family protein [Caldilinea sp. CFX5]